MFEKVLGVILIDGNVWEPLDESRRIRLHGSTHSSNLEKAHVEAAVKERTIL